MMGGNTSDVGYTGRSNTYSSGGNFIIWRTRLSPLGFSFLKISHFLLFYNITESSCRIIFELLR